MTTPERLLLLAVGLVAGVVVAQVGAPAGASEFGGGPAIAACGAAALGALVGVSELVSRYTDSPEKALREWSGILYIAVNVLAAASAFCLAHYFDLLHLDGKSPEARMLTEALVAGLGAMVVFRSAVFTVRVDGTDVAVGPASVLQVILNAVDRATDRERALPRANFISRLMNGVSFNAAADILPQFCFSAMQNVRPAERQVILDWIKQLKTETLDDAQKTLLLGLRLLNIVGPDVLQSTVLGLGPRIRTALDISLSVGALLQFVQFDIYFRALEALCFALAQGTVGVNRDELRRDIDAIGKESFDNDVKVLLLASALLKAFGADVVGRALAMLPPAPT